MTRLIDLSQEIYPGMPLYPGHLKTQIWDYDTHAETAPRFEGGFSYASKGILISDHGPTHVDAISHLDPSPGAPAIDRMPLETFYARATCIDLSGKAPFENISAEDLARSASPHQQAVEEAEILLLYTATYDRARGTPTYATDYPGLDRSASEWLADRAFKAFGVDAPSPDNPRSRDYPCHMVCRERGMTHFENLANLGDVVGKRFTFIGFPLKLRNGTGSPVRAVAALDEPS